MGRHRRSTYPAVPQLRIRLDEHWELPNGIQLLVEQVPSMYSVTIGIWVLGGSCDEEPAYNGTAHMLEHLLAGSSQRRTPRQLALTFERLGSDVNAYTTKELTCYHVQTLPRHTARVLQLLAEQLFRPRLSRRAVERERRIILEELLACADDPEEVLYEHAERLLFGTHPLGMPIAGTPESLRHLTPEVLYSFHSRFYVGERIIITIVGNLSPGDAYRAVVEAFAGVPRRRSELPPRQPPSPQPAREEILQRPFQQASVLFARLLPRGSPDERSSLALLNFVLGEGWGSRLYQRLRERYGLVYSVASELEWYSTCGVWSISASTHPDNLQRIEALITEELHRLSQSGITAEELERGRTFLYARLAMALDSPLECMGLLARAVADHEPLPSLDAIHQQLQQLSADTLNAAAATYCQPTEWSRVRLLPSASP